MWNIAGFVMSFAGYAAVLAFALRVTWRLLGLLRIPAGPEIGRSGGAAAAFLAVWDIVFLRRLFAVNKPLWFGEWVFHVSFVLVVLRHLRYFLLPVPEWIVVIQPLGLWAGFALPGSVIYILFIRFVVQRKEYASRENLVLTVFIFLVGGTGVLMHALPGPDIVAVKHFVLSALAFTPAALPGHGLFLFHFGLACLLVPLLPRHIMAAPYMSYDAQLREAGIGRVVHDKA